MVSSEANLKLVRKVAALTEVYTSNKATYLLCHSFNIAENTYDKQSLIAGANNLGKNTQKSNFEKEVS